MDIYTNNPNRNAGAITAHDPLSPPVSYYGVLKRWTGGSWLKVVLKTWTGTTWVSRPMYLWDGSTWQSIDVGS
jgi:hypothetical protein